MRVIVKLFANLTRFVPGNSAGKAFDVELADQATIQDLLNYLKIPAGETQIVFINHIIEEKDSKLKDSDVVGIFPLVAGG